MSQQDNNQMQQHFYRASAVDFQKIPGSPISYWLHPNFYVLYDNPSISSLYEAKEGVGTRNDAIFMRMSWEVSIDNVAREKRWVLTDKAGDFRKWYMGPFYVLDWEDDGYRIKNYRNDDGSLRSRPQNTKYLFKSGVSWGKIGSGVPSFRWRPEGQAFNDAAPTLFGDGVYTILGQLNSVVIRKMLEVGGSTLNITTGVLNEIPILNVNNRTFGSNVDQLIKISKRDWDKNEISWDFKKPSIFEFADKLRNLGISYKSASVGWQETSLEMQRLEQENNRLFIEAYGLQDELTPEVPLSEITLTCNPHYRYGGNLSDEEREARLQSDTIAELISYAIGCMMGRYSLDREGLVYAHAGNEGFKALVEEGAYATFAADEDGILPLSTDSWFADDVATRLEAFVCSVWGKETLEENLQFIADSLCLSAIKPVKKGGETSREILRRYLSTQFYKDHLKTYKKRPIYWLFSSGKEKAFECLVYLHRYNETTLPRMRTEYVTPLLGQMAGRIERLRLQQTEAGTAEAKRIGKEIDSLTKQLAELRAFDDQLKHHADMRITLDLDDGVKVNYGKFGTLLSDVKAITGDKGE